MRDPLLVWVARLSAAMQRRDVPHVVVGGLAIAAWARPRATVDIDLVVPESALSAVRDAARAAGVLQTGARAVAFKRLRLVRMIAPDDLAGEPIAVDVLLLPAALEKVVIERSISAKLGDRVLSIASPEDVIVLKLLRDSEQDRADIWAILSERRVSRRYIEGWARRLRVLGRWRRFTSRRP
jgi:hypothetical protein